MMSLYILAAAVLALIVLYSARRRVLRTTARLLVVNDAAASCDAIVLLNGNISTRAYRAAELHRRTGAPILMARLADTEEVRIGVLPNITDATRDLLLHRGAPADSVRVVSSDRWIAGTWAEAMLLAERIRAAGWREVAIVTDAFHTRRARWTFRTAMAGEPVVFTCAATPFSLGLIDRWWRSEYGVVQVIIEYIKLIYYRFAYGKAARRGPPSVHDLPPVDMARRQVAGEGPGQAPD